MIRVAVCDDNELQLSIMKDVLTASVDYAVASYEVDAFYYMIKPVDRPKLERVPDKAVETVDERDDSIMIKTRNGFVSINLADIMYVDLVNRTLQYHLNNGLVVDGLVIRSAFKEANAAFLKDRRFASCGISLLVNLNYIMQMDNESILFNDGTLVYVSKTACAGLKKIWKERKLKEV